MDCQPLKGWWIIFLAIILIYTPILAHSGRLSLTNDDRSDLNQMAPMEVNDRDPELFLDMKLNVDEQDIDGATSSYTCGLKNELAVEATENNGDSLTHTDLQFTPTAIGHILNAHIVDREPPIDDPCRVVNIQYLESIGADSTVSITIGCNRLNIVDQTEMISVVRAILSDGRVGQMAINSKGLCGYTPLQWAIIFKQAKIAKELLRLGADRTVCDDNGLTPLHFASKYTRIDLAIVLLENADSSYINTQDTAGQTPIHVAIPARPSFVQGVDEVEMVNFLLSQGGNRTIRNDGGRTALHYAARSFRVDLAQILLKDAHSSYINLKDNFGITALHLGIPFASSGNTDFAAMVKCLLNHGADQTITDNEGQTPLHYSALLFRVDIAIILLARAVPRYVNLKDDRGNTALHIALRRHVGIPTTDRVALIKCLVNHGANPLLRNRENMSSLGLAMRYGFKKIFSSLFIASVHSAIRPHICLSNHRVWITSE
uniref:Uncharacterized protein n=1 Tax=Spongospora subterranea TaxID=70186 RepID=A0A0H5R403_9EUKA|eukprot:CRZ08641.1 hypothetical protein [Spongospora subterranea]